MKIEMKIEHLDTLKEILSEPSAPFRESFVLKKIQNLLESHQIPYFVDKTGNCVLGAKSAAVYKKILKTKQKHPLPVFIAHTDHPGFHGEKWIDDAHLKIKWHGGAPTELLDGASVWLATSAGLAGTAKIKSAELIASGRSIDTAVLEINSQDAKTLAALKAAKSVTEIFGGFHFGRPQWTENDLIYTKAADDLVGAFCIVSLAISLKSKFKKDAPPFIGLLTRAEEVGFIGCIGHFQEGYFEAAKRELLFVSLETSRQLPGAEIGKGPVVRLGDRFTVFDSAALRAFTDLAEKTLPSAHQRRIMDGGTCEGTVAASYGFSTVGISVPLGNYHNQSFEGGPESRGPNGPAPEFVSLSDIAGLLALCRAIVTAKMTHRDAFRAKMKSFREDFKKYRPLLKG